MSTLNALLAPGAAIFNGEAATREEAIRLAGQLLVDSGATTAAYTEAMVSTVEEYGPYIVLAPGFALAHARPSEAVNRTAISWVRLESPVKFGHKSNDPVRLVVALAATDSSAHLGAMKELAGLLGNPDTRARMEAAASEGELRAVLDEAGAAPKQSHAEAGRGASEPADTEPADTERSDTERDVVEHAAHQTSADSVRSKGKIYTVCGNGLGTSLFLKNTVDQVLDAWGWSKYLDVEATDTISAKGRAKEADFLLTSGAIAATLGDVGVPVRVIEDFTSRAEIDSVLRELYDV